MRVWLTLEYAIIAFPLNFMEVYVAWKLEISEKVEYVRTAG
jgi:hypothetical protein